MAFNPSEWEPLSPNAQKAVDDLVRQRQAARSTRANLQHGIPSIGNPPSQTYANNQHLAMANSPFTTPSFTHTPTLQIPPTEASLVFQPSFRIPYGYEQAQQHGSTYIPFPDALSDSDFILNNAQNNSFQSEQLAPAYTPWSSKFHSPNTTRPQGLSNVASESNAPSMGSSSPADATIIAPGATAMMPPPGIGSLRFDSYAVAFATVDHMFRDPITIKDDDVLEVVRDKRRHVKSLVDAMKHGGSMTAVDYKKTEQGRNQNVD
jgi:hypothetical protein